MAVQAIIEALVGFPADVPPEVVSGAVEAVVVPQFGELRGCRVRMDDHWDTELA